MAYRVDHCMTSDDTDFRRKAADIIGLYLHPPQHAAVFCVDEKTAIWPVERHNPAASAANEESQKRVIDSYRPGTLSLYAAFNTQTEESLGKTASRHTSAEFVAFLTDILFSQPAGREIHVIADNLSAHKTVQVKEFLVAHCNVHLHFAPTYSSWLKQVATWFAQIEHDVAARTELTSVSNLRRKLMSHIRYCNKAPKAVKWMHCDPTPRVATDSMATVH